MTTDTNFSLLNCTALHSWHIVTEMNSEMTTKEA